MEGDRALRKRAPVNYSQTTPQKWQTPEKERAKERARNRLAKSNEAAGDKENGLLFCETVAAAAEPQEIGPQYKKKAKPAKKLPAELLKEVPAGSVDHVEGAKTAEAKVQKAKNGKKAAAQGVAAEQTGPGTETSDKGKKEGVPKTEKGEDETWKVPVEKKAGGAGRKAAAPALDKKKVAKQIAAAVAVAVEKASGEKKGKQTSTGSTKAAKAGGSNGSDRTVAGSKGSKRIPAGEANLAAKAQEKGKTAAVSDPPAEPDPPASFQSGAVSKRAEKKAAANTRGTSRKAANGGGTNTSEDGASRGGARKRKSVEGKPEREPEPKKVARGGRKRKAEGGSVVELDGGEDEPPQKKATGPSAALVPYIDASKAAAERQRGWQGREKTNEKQTAAFLKLEEAYNMLRSKYDTLKSSTLQETESLFEEQKRVVKTHGEAAMKLVSHWKGEAARLQEERAAMVEMKQREREVAQENALLNIKFVEQEEQRVIVEARLQELEAELHDVSERASAAARPPPATRSAAVQVPTPDVRAKWAADASVQVQTDELPLPPTALPASPLLPAAEPGLEEGLGQGLSEGLSGDPDADNAWRELLQILTGCCADECGGNKIRFTHEKSELVFYLTGTPQDDDVTCEVTRDVDTLSRASSFFDADSAGNVSFLYEPESFGLLDDDVSADSELRRPKALTMREVPRLMVEIMAQTTRVS